MAELAPLEAYAEPFSVRHMTMSPSGTRVAYRLTRADRDAIYVVDIGTGKALRSITLKESNVRSMAMYSDEKLYIYYFVPKALYDYYYLRVFDVESGKLGYAFNKADYDNETVPRFFSVQPIGMDPDGKFMFVSGITPANLQRANVYKLDFQHGLIPHSQAQGTRNTIDWFARPEDRMWIREDFNPDNDEHAVTIMRDDEETVVYEHEGEGPERDFVGLTADRSSLVYATKQAGQHRLSYHAMNIEDGTTQGPMFMRHSGYALRHPDGTIFGFVDGQAPSVRQEFLDDDFSQRFRVIEQSFPGATVEIVTATPDLQRLIVRVSGDWSKAFYMLFTAGDPKPVLVARSEGAISSKQAVPRRVHEYFSDDGRPVRALVTAEADVIAKGKAPVMVLTNWRYNDFTGRDVSWIAQYFASRGYVVVQPESRYFQFSGRFSPQDEPDWRADMLGDADIVVGKLVDQGLIDPKRMCAFGIAEGGFTAVSAGYRSAHQYRCVGGLRAYTDLPQTLSRYLRSSRDLHRDPTVLGLQRRYGFTSTDKDSVEAVSPEAHAAEFSAATLLVYFKKGGELRRKDAKRMARELERNGKDVDLVELGGDDRYLDRLDGREKLLRTLADFVHKHNPP